MNCPYCGAESQRTRVVLTRKSPDNQRVRKRKCLDCDFVFFSLETVISAGQIKHVPNWGLELLTDVSDTHSNDHTSTENQ